METLRYGSRGNGVLLLQLALRREGSLTALPDGVFGSKTLNAVRRFQSANGLVPDGAAGERTFAAAEPYLLGSVRYRLRRGDTFFRLGKRFSTSADAIAAANPALDPAELPIGSEVTIPLGFPVTPTDIPYSSRLSELVCEGLVMRYPFIARERIGLSALGKPLTVLRMGRGKRRVFINAAHHANEWITTPLVLDFAESLARASVTGGTVAGRSAAALLKSVTLLIMPMVDPDGVDIVNGAESGAALERALSIAEGWPEIPFPSGWKANAEGTDLNLNYPADWEQAKKLKYSLGFTGPAPRDFVGSAPLSAPESRAVYEFTKAVRPDASLSYHTQGGEIYWRFKDVEPEGAFALGRRMAEASGYSLADVPDGSSNAGYRDWFIAEFELPGYTVEAGYGRNPLPLSQYDELKQDNFPLMAAFLEGAK